MESELLGETPVCSPAEPVHWQFLTLLDTVGRRNGQVLVMEMDDVHEASPLVQMDFAQELFRGIDLKAKLHRKEEIKEEEPEMQPQLVFMLWQSVTLRQLMQWEHLDETLWNLRNLFPCMPAALVLVMIQPDLQHQQVELERAAGALRRMQCLLDGGFQELVVEAAVYSPGQPNGILEVKRAACRALREVLKGQEGTGGVRGHTGLGGYMSWKLEWGRGTAVSLSANHGAAGPEEDLQESTSGATKGPVAPYRLTEVLEHKLSWVNTHFFGCKKWVFTHESLCFNTSVSL
uniref:C2orf72-like C-terminal domain-containing protein n=1 Tax=Chelydra serpentina TaxID=8475 RepID=A0A8C3SNE0_CHESE